MKKRMQYNVFSKRIVELQDKHGYTDNQILDLLRKSNGDPWINNSQTYYTWRSGSRLPNEFQAALVAFADFYGVSTDYLLREDAPETPQIKAVQDATGLSVEAVKNIMDFNNSYPEIMKMIDTIFSYASGEGQAFIINLYNQILNDYRDKKNKESQMKTKKGKKNVNPKSTYDFDHEYELMQSRILHTQQAYNYLSSIVMDNLSDSLDKQLKQQDNEYEYYSTLLNEKPLPPTQPEIYPCNYCLS